MFEIFKSTILAGGYKLTAIVQKIKKLYIWGDLTESQADELLAMASGGASTDAERPETLRLIQALAAKIEALENRVTVLEGAGNDDPDAPEEQAYSQWTPWDGISKDYQKGAVVSHNGGLWESVFAGQNVWEPGTAGTEAMWVK